MVGKLRGVGERGCDDCGEGKLNKGAGVGLTEKGGAWGATVINGVDTVGDD